jgi:hypothetical protein
VQKREGVEYRSALARELERAGYAVERSSGGFRIVAISRDVERAFSKRRQAIEAAAKAYGYVSPRGMELAALRTRRTKRDVNRDALFELWRAEARGLGLELNRDAARAPLPPMTNSLAATTIDRQIEATLASLTARLQPADRLALRLSKVTTAMKAMDQSAVMSGLAVDLRQRDRELDRR